jgi:2,4-dienoyl-CoA reductase-like NADH-dependent reductase (Old Yellow Enzyme family)
MPPLVIWAAEEEGLVTNRHIEHYGRCVGPGLVIVEAATVAPEGRLAKTQLGAFDDAHVDGLARLAARIAENGSVPGIQIHHAGGRTDIERTYGNTLVVPSLVDPAANGHRRELTEEDIARIIDDFGRAAGRVAAAGFRLVEVHGAHGYLGSQFLSPKTNRRTDRWGGSVANRARFLEEVVRRVREVVDDDVAVTVRLGVAEAGEDGLTLSDGIEAARILEAAGADMLHVSHAGSMPQHLRPEGSRFSALIHAAAAVKAVVSVPVIAVGGIKMPDEAEHVLEAGYADYVAVGRGILADPRWAEKSLAGNAHTIERCQDCEPRCHFFTDPRRCPARRRVSGAQ